MAGREALAWLLKVMDRCLPVLVVFQEALADTVVPITCRVAMAAPQAQADTLPTDKLATTADTRSNGMTFVRRLLVLRSRIGLFKPSYL